MSIASNKLVNLGDAQVLYNDLRGRVENRAEKLVADITTPASVQTFTDGSDGMPMKVTVGIEPVQDLHGYEYPWPGGSGKNLFGPNNNPSIGRYVKSDGDIAQSSSWILSDYISVLPETKYTFNPNSTTGSSAKTAYYDANKTFIDFIASGAQTFTTPSNCAYMRFSYRDESYDIQLELGSTSTSYMPYSNICPISGLTGANIYIAPTYDQDDPDKETYSITFPNPPGTVYGGTLTVYKNGTGKLVVDRKSILGSTLSWSYATSYAYFTSAVSDIKATAEGNTPKLLCDRYKTTTTKSASGWSSAENLAIGQRNGYQSIVVKDTNYTDKDIFASAVSDMQIVYELATPVTYELTAPQVLSLLGTNNVWCDTGDVLSIEYNRPNSSGMVSAVTFGDGITVPDGNGTVAIDSLIPVTDVKVNGTSILSQGVANVPVAADNGVLGVATVYAGRGLGNTDGKFYVDYAGDSVIKTGTNSYRAITPNGLKAAVFYGLSKLAGEDLKNDTVTVGAYPEKSLSAISQMLNAPVSVSGTTPSITAKPGVRYVCGEVSTLTIVAPASGCIDVTFTSGSTATVLTVSSAKTGVTAIKWANGFDPTSLEANTVYEINILDGEFGVVGSWT